MPSPTQAQQLRCEYQVDPAAIDTLKPSLSWIIVDRRRGVTQGGYQVMVASSLDRLLARKADLWDSGKVVSNKTIDIEYGGSLLRSRQRCYWKVRVWNQEGEVSDWSSPARWTMGLNSATDWHAKWIMRNASEDISGQGLPLFRRLIDVRKQIRNARLYICGLGQYTLRVNGVNADDSVLDPGWTDYRKTCLYRAYDIKPLLNRGLNALGVMLGSGMYDVSRQGGRYAKFVGSFGPKKLIAQLEIDYTGGTQDTFITDSAWKCSHGPITLSSIYGGEDYDARREQSGWDQPTFDDSAWSPCVVTAGPGGELRGTGHSGPPIKVIRTLNPVKVKNVRPSVSVYDLGQNGAMIPRISAIGPRGSIVRIIPGEKTNPDGTVSQQGSGGPAYFEYTMRGNGLETWAPQFSYYGARYFQVECAAGSDARNQNALPVLQRVQGLFVSSAPEPCGEFSCSNELFNRTAQMIDWAMRSNMMSVLTDCPHRERLGWLEQTHLVGPSLMYRFDSEVLLSKMVADMADAQLPDGLIPDIAPELTVFSGGFRDSPEWGSAFLIVPWNLYRWYGNIEILRRNYAGMKRYVDYLGTKANNGILSHGLGDWYDIGPKPPGYAQLTPPALTATAFYLRDLEILGRVAALLDKPTDASALAATAKKARKAFNAAFYDATLKTYATGSQTANAIPLSFGLVDPNNIKAVRASLVKAIRADDDRLTAGDVGYRYLLRALADSGQSDLIFDMNRRSDRPGYGWMLDHGATTLTEAWDADPNSSQNHFMLGHIQEWFYGDLAGIQQAAGSVAYSEIVIKPAIVGDIRQARATYHSAAGRIVSDWKIADGDLCLFVDIPANTTATVFIPGCDPARLLEGSLPIKDSKAAKYLGSEDGNAVIHVGSGTYSFKSPYAQPNPSL